MLVRRADCWAVCVLPCPQGPDGMPGKSAVLMELRKLRLYAVQVGVHFSTVASLNAC